MNFGMNVTITFPNRPIHMPGRAVSIPTMIVLHNVTQVHGNYRGKNLSRILGGESIAFESDIHNTGITYKIADIEFVVEVADRQFETF